MMIKLNNSNNNNNNSNNNENNDTCTNNYNIFLFKHKLFVKTFAQEQKCSSKELTQSQYMYIYLPKSTNVVQVQCMGSDMH